MTTCELFKEYFIDHVGVIIPASIITIFATVGMICYHSISVSEINPRRYDEIKEYVILYPEIKNEVSKCFQDGEITNWEWWGIEKIVNKAIRKKNSNASKGDLRQTLANVP